MIRLGYKTVVYFLYVSDKDIFITLTLSQIS